MVSDRDWLLASPTEREIIAQLQSIKVGVWLIASLLGSTMVAVAFVIAFHV